MNAVQVVPTGKPHGFSNVNFFTGARDFINNFRQQSVKFIIEI